eukprot:TRINITY_DN18596_c0_g1_i3.p1 TRINITY_DN18596_c0_g1~~TRINITY_DN18596_c0_g1_i3.p1  ORF type:complete len:409 (+),score=21.68 TRINITY_DN18596_c0_g1_i3:39-1229(+)
MEAVQLEHISTATSINDAVNLRQQLEASKRDNQKLIQIRQKISEWVASGGVEKPGLRGYKKKLTQIQARVNNAQQTSKRLSDQVSEFRSDVLQSLMKQIAQIYETVQSDCERISEKLRVSPQTDQQKSLNEQQAQEVSKSWGNANKRRIKKVEQQLVLQFKKMQSVREMVQKQTREQVQLAVHAGLLEDQISESLLTQYGKRLETYANVTGSQVEETAERVQLLDQRYKNQQLAREKAVNEVKQRIATLRRDFNKIVKSINYTHQDNTRVSRNSQVYSNNSLSPLNGSMYNQKATKQDQPSKTPRSTLSTIDNDANLELDEMYSRNVMKGSYRSQSSRSLRQPKLYVDSKQEVVNLANGMQRSQSSRSVRKIASNSPRDKYEVGQQKFWKKIGYHQ